MPGPACLRRSRSLGLALAALCAVAQVPAQAADGDVWTPYVSYTVNYEDNLLRLHDRASALATLGTDKTSDTVTHGIAGIRVDKQFLRQEVTADLSVNHDSFDRFTQLDNTGKNAKGHWAWHASDNLDGDVISTYASGLAPYADVREPTRVVRVDRFNLLEARYLVTPSWRMRGGLTRYSLDYDLDSLRPYDLVLSAAQAGLEYLPSTGSSVGMQLSHSRGSYPNGQALAVNSVDGSFEQNEVKGTASWNYSGKTRLQFLGGWVQRKQDVSSIQNFSGLNARLIADWTPTGKVGVSTFAFREFGASDDVNANYTLNTGFKVAATWDVSYKVRIDASVMQQRSNYNGIATIIDSGTTGRNDRTRKLTLGSVYRPTQHLKLAGGVFSSMVDSTINELGYHANGASVSAEYDF